MPERWGVSSDIRLIEPAEFAPNTILRVFVPHCAGQGASRTELLGLVHG